MSNESDENNSVFTEELFYLENIISLLPGHVWWKDIDGRVLGCNESQLRDLGFHSKKDVIGKTWDEIIPSNQSQEEWLKYAAVIDQVDQRVMQTGIGEIVEEMMHMEDGSRRPCISHKVALRDKNNTIAGLLGVAIDISAQKELEQKLLVANTLAEEANRAKTEFLENMQHDIRTPLSSIMILLDTLKNKTMNEDVKESFLLLEQICQQVLTLCRNFSDAQLTETGQEFIHAKDMNIHEGLG